MNKPTAVQKRFNTLMERIERERALAAELREAIDSHVPAHQNALRTIKQESQRLCREMVLLLDAHIQAPSKPKGLTANQKQQATHMLLSLCEQLLQATAGDEAMQAVYERYEDMDALEEADREAKEQAQEMLESYLGADFAQGREFDSPEDVLRAAMEFEQQRQRAQAEKREAKRAARKAAKGATARELAAQQKEQDANSALRTVFRQLASALHPDREPDEALRVRKTELMSEVNAAYERKDLSTLLRIQLEAEVLDASKVATLTEAKLKAMCDLLAGQVKTLEEENKHIRQGLDYEFGYPSYMRYEASRFAQMLQAEREALQGDIEQMRADILRVQDDKELKAWLKEQVRVSKARAREWM